ncbi:MAG: 2-amino-4-hydroxy-6-hydroxymethyldihydropteridine diphosphokinase [Hyphomicrobiaceae bacterium]
MAEEQKAFDAVIALGSNIGDKFSNMSRAIEILTRRGDIQVVKRSRDFKTPPWGKTDQDWFANGALSVATGLSPRHLLDRCQSVEREMGRTLIEKWGPRVIDLDILVFGDLVVDEQDLQIPHPFLTERGFVLAPMADVAPEFIVKGQTISQWLEMVDLTGIKAVGLSKT